MVTYYPTIGLEVHVELNTRSKMFCGCKNDPNEKSPNANICPVCMAHPGTLPVINRQAVKNVLRVGAAIGATLADYTEFDRKSYFYPDLPKGYQLSQYAYPLVSGGELHGVQITRIHLEEDTARSQHDPKTGKTLVDYNRAGVPLMELVTEPVLHSAEDAGNFARELQILLRTLGVSEANMEKGEMRVEANISISTDPNIFGTKVEVKNLNSFKSVEKAIAYELARHEAVLADGGVITQETRGWDENKQSTFAQRVKEGSADYRYFPDPDLPKLKLSLDPELNKDAIRATLPLLPDGIRALYTSFGISLKDIETYLGNPELQTFFESVHTQFTEAASKKLASNYITSDIVNLQKEIGHISLSPNALVDIIRMIEEGVLSSRSAKDVLAIIATDGGEPREVAAAKGLIQSNDTDLFTKVVQELIAENPAVVAEYKNGKDAALQFFVGQSMKRLQGSGNPVVLQKLIRELL